MERLIVRNFGPIKDVEIDLKKFNIFIGNTSTGKSTIAKLVSLIYNIDFNSFDTEGTAVQPLLKTYNIDFLTKKTEIIYSRNDLICEIKKGKIFVSNSKLAPKKLSDLEFALLGLQLAVLVYDATKLKEDNANTSLLDDKKQHQEIIDNVISKLSEFRSELQQGVDNKKKINVINKMISNLSEYNTHLYINNLKNSLNLITLLNNSLKDFDSIYIPAERIFFSTLEDSIFSLLKADVNIPDCITSFGTDFQKAKSENKNFEFDFLGIKYLFEDNKGYSIQLSDNKTKVKLGAASSGFQSIIPLLLVCENELKSDEFEANKVITIEEPEQNLYPTIQKGLLDYLIVKTNPTDNKLVITTHSPYFLNLIDLYLKVKKYAVDTPKLEERLVQILPKELWLNVDDISCYYFEDGKVYDIVDRENASLNLERFDSISAELSDLYNEILEVVYE